MSKLNDYYEKTAASDSHIIAVGTCMKFYQHAMTDVLCSPSPWKEAQILYEELGCCARRKSKKFSARKSKWDIFLNIYHFQYTGSSVSDTLAFTLVVGRKMLCCAAARTPINGQVDLEESQTQIPKMKTKTINLLIRQKHGWLNLITISQ